jgi:hypothetical protein
VAHALVEDVAIVSADDTMDLYGIRRILVKRQKENSDRGLVESRRGELNSTAPDFLGYKTTQGLR